MMYSMTFVLLAQAYIVVALLCAKRHVCPGCEFAGRGLFFNGVTMYSKKARLLALLQKQYVTPHVALREVGIMSLSQRISEWRRQGYEFAQVWREVNGGRVAAYKLTKVPR